MENNQTLSPKDFQTVKKLGHGTFSTIKLVRHNQTGRQYAFKQVSMDRLTMHEKQRALNQVRLMASVQSPYIISYQGSFFYPKNNQLCLLMQYSKGGSLEELINKTKKNKGNHKQGLDQQFIWRIVIDTMNGLNTMHDNKIVHRDLKPANIFLSEKGAKIGDFSVSIASQNSFYKTKTGTPYYASPQIWKGQNYTNNCDVWSLGCVAYEMCSGDPPFKADNFPELLNIISKGIYKPLSENYSDDLRTFIRLCLNIDPTDRPSISLLFDNSIVMRKIKQYKIIYRGCENVQLLKQIKCPKNLRFISEILPVKETDRVNKPSEEKSKSCIRIRKAKSNKTITISQPNNLKIEQERKRIATMQSNKTSSNKFRLRSCKKMGEDKQN